MIGTSAAAICRRDANDSASPYGGLNSDFFKKNYLKSIEISGLLCKLEKLYE